MNSENEKLLYFKNARIELEKVRFDKIESNEKNKEQLKIDIIDSYKVEYFDNRKLVFLFSRKVSLVPSSLFVIEVEYDVALEFADNTKKEFTEKNDELGKLINNKIEKIINLSCVPAKASTLISDLTMNNNGNPIVTPPSLIKKSL